MSEKDIADALHDYTNRSSTDPITQSLSGEFLYATYVSFEAVDPDLSRIRLADGTFIGGCPRAASVTGLGVGDLLLCASPGSGKVITILCRVIGDVTKYEAS